MPMNSSQLAALVERAKLRARPSSLHRQRRHVGAPILKGVAHQHRRHGTTQRQ